MAEVGRDWCRKLGYGAGSGVTYKRKRSDSLVHCGRQKLQMLKEKHEHVDKLPGVKAYRKISIFTTDLTEAIRGKRLCSMLAVPSVFTRSTAKSYGTLCNRGADYRVCGKGY